MMRGVGVLDAMGRARLRLAALKWILPGQELLMRKAYLIGIVLVGVFLGACASGGTPAGDKASAGAAGKTPATAAATSTAPAVAETTAPAYAADKAQSFSGRSDKLIKLKGLSSDRVHVAKMTYKGSSNFIVKSLDSDGEEIGLLANVIGRYSGNVAIELSGFSDEIPAAISVKTQGSWTITIGNRLGS
jgi:hypothetical protein